MDHLQPEAQTASGSIVIPENEGKAPFSASKQEIAAALLSFVLGWIYLRRIWFFNFDLHAVPTALTVFTLGFLALGEYLSRGRPRPRESWVWLGCALVTAAAVAFDRCNALDERLCHGFAFLHLFAVWWLLSRCGVLHAGESGRLLPLDAVNGFLIIPWKNIFLRARTLYFAFCASVRSRLPGRPNTRTLLWSAFVAVTALGMLSLAMQLLCTADDGFSSLMESVTGAVSFRLSEDLAGELIFIVLSLPVSAWLFGLLGGSLREDRARLNMRMLRLETGLKKLQGVPARLWQILLALFCAVYALFCAVQGRYLFGAFTRTLPEGFIVSAYARRGFFELCKVMTVNFALLYLARRTAKSGGLPRILSAALLGESLLLAVVAFSKLALYVDCFGFTPRRLQSLWLVCVLACGCVCALVALFTRKKAFRAWMIFGAVSLSLLCLY